MKITIGDMELVRGKAFCEDAFEFKTNGRKELQISSLLRAKEVKVFDRGNTKTTVNFKMKRQHKDSEEAMRFIMSHGERVSNAHGDAVFDLEDAMNSVFVLNEACIGQVELKFKGVTTYHSYEIIGSKISKQ